MPADEIAIEQQDSWLCGSAAAWGFLHDLFRAPTAAQWQWLRTDAVREAWARLSECPGEPHPRALPLAAEFEAYEQQYLATFDVGLPSPPCPLVESHWNKQEPTARTLHEHILFYKCFGLELRPAAGESADHLRHQLEFMAYLCRLEAAERFRPTRPAMAGEIARGRRDFLARHLLSWVPRAAAEAEKQLPESWPAAWLALLADVCRLHAEFESEEEAV